MPGKRWRLAQGLPTPDVRPSTIQHPYGRLYASGFAFSLGEERQPKIWKTRVTNGEERLIATMSSTLLALFEKRRIDLEIHDPQEFLRYFGKIHQRTMPKGSVVTHSVKMRPSATGQGAMRTKGTLEKTPIKNG